MVSEQLLQELHKLNRADKLRVMQILVNDLTIEEDSILFPNHPYEVWSPTVSSEAAQALLATLEEEKNLLNG